MPADTTYNRFDLMSPEEPAWPDELPQASYYAADGRALVMQSYLQLMDQFLKTQALLMQQYLTGVGGPGAGAAGQGATLTLPAGARAAPTPARGTAPRIGAATIGAETPAGSGGGPTFGRTAVVAPVPSDDDLAPSWEPAQRAPDGRAPDPERTAPATPLALSGEELHGLLLELVSLKTGYPPEVLSLTANLEADLGIDSIKLVEILGAFNLETGLVQGDAMEQVSSLKTLGAILDFFAERPTPPQV